MSDYFREWELVLELLSSVLKTSSSGDWIIRHSSPAHLIAQVIADLLLPLAEQAGRGWRGPPVNPEFLPNLDDFSPWPEGLEPSSTEGFERIIAGPKQRKVFRGRGESSSELKEYFYELSHWFRQYSEGRIRVNRPKRPATSEKQYQYWRRNRRRQRQRKTRK
jgi:hypothetical protein